MYTLNVIMLFKNRIKLIFGWLEIIFKPKNNYGYKFTIEKIEIQKIKNEFFSIVYYKSIGCRKLHLMSAIEMNKNSLFALFKPDHAQMLVSIATAETLINMPSEKMNDKLKTYIMHCNIKLNHGNN